MGIKEKTTKHQQRSDVIISPTRPITPYILLSNKFQAIKAIRPIRLRGQTFKAAEHPNQPSPSIDQTTSPAKEERKEGKEREKTHELNSAFSGTTVDSEPNFVNAVVEPGAAGESLPPNCFRVSSLRLREWILTLLRLRMKPFVEAPTKRGRSKGRQAPTMPREDSTMGQ